MLKDLIVKEYEDQGYVLANRALDDIRSGKLVDAVVIRVNGKVEAKSGLVTRSGYWPVGVDGEYPPEASIYFLGDNYMSADDGDILLYRISEPLPRDREELIAQAMATFPGAAALRPVSEWLNAVLATHENMILVQATDWDSSSLHC